MLQRAAAVSDRNHDSDERRCQFMICPTPFYTAPYFRSKWEGLQLVSPLDLISDCRVMTPCSAISMCYLKRNGFPRPVSRLEWCKGKMLNVVSSDRDILQASFFREHPSHRIYKMSNTWDTGPSPIVSEDVENRRQQSADGTFSRSSPAFR